jgi:hypothetical protein
LHYFLPPSLFSASQFRVWIPRPRPEIAFSPLVNSADSRSGRVGGGLDSPLSGFSPNTEVSFLMISPYLLDICPVFLLVFSPLETADFSMLFKPYAHAEHTRRFLMPSPLQVPQCILSLQVYILAFMYIEDTAQLWIHYTVGSVAELCFNIL